MDIPVNHLLGHSTRSSGVHFSALNSFPIISPLGTRSRSRRHVEEKTRLMIEGNTRPTSRPRFYFVISFCVSYVKQLTTDSTTRQIR